MLFSIPALFLTGYIFPLSGLPWWLLPISYAHPITHQMEIVRGIILRGSSFSDLLPHFFYLAVAPFVLIGLSVRRFRESLYS